MMLPLVGLITIVAVLAAILSKRVSPLVALIAFPILAALATGFGLETSRFILSGIQGIAGVIGMFVFAILFFGVLTDAKMLEPVVAWLLRMIGSRPSRIVPGSALLALLVHLDGSGAVVFLDTIPALLPLYQRVGIACRGSQLFAVDRADSAGFGGVAYLDIESVSSADRSASGGAGVCLRYVPGAWYSRGEEAGKNCLGIRGDFCAGWRRSGSGSD
jgi:hypothetical protein